MLTWLISGWIHLGIGFAAGWLIFKRPDYMTAAISWIKSKIGLGA